MRACVLEREGERGVSRYRLHQCSQCNRKDQSQGSFISTPPTPPFGGRKEGEAYLFRNDGVESALGQGAVTNFSAAGVTHAASLSHGGGWKKVLQIELPQLLLVRQPRQLLRIRLRPCFLPQPLIINQRQILPCAHKHKG